MWRTSVMLAATLLAGCDSAEPPRPNVLLVTVDTLRADHTSIGGHDHPTTPALERLAQQGAHFTRAWAASSWTSPSMAMLMTGRARTDNSGKIAPRELPLAAILAGHGYETAAVIANPLLNEAQGYGIGVEHLEVFPPGRPKGSEWAGDEVVDRGLAWLEGRDERRPFYLYLHLFDPHYPYHPEGVGEAEPRDDPRRRAALRDALPAEERGALTDEAYRGIETLIDLYDRDVLQADRALGRLLEQLEREGLATDTVVLVTSDHGEGLWQRAPAIGEERKQEVFFPALYYSHGVQLYSEQVHVPLVLRGPGVPSGPVDADVSLLDVLPTLLDLLDIEAPRDLSGLSLLDRAGLSSRGEVYGVCSRVTTVTVGGRWRLHQPRGFRVERFGAAPALFDLDADPREVSPVDDPERVSDLQARIARWRADHERVGVDATDPAQAAILEALGYTGEADR